MPPDHPEVGRRKQRMQLSGVFCKTPVADFGKSELALDHSEGILDRGAYTRFELLDPFADFVGLQIGQRATLTWSHRDMPESVSAFSFFNSPIPGIGKDIGFRSMQQGFRLSADIHMGIGVGNALHQTRLSINPNMGHNAKVPLMTFLGLMHLWVSPRRGALCRARRCNGRRIHDRALGESESTAGQATSHRLKNPHSQPVSLEQASEVQNRGLIWDRPWVQRPLGQGPQRGNLVQGLFHCWTTQPVPLLHEVRSQHRVKCVRSSPITRLGIHRLDQRINLVPRHYLIHLGQKDRSPRLFALEGIFRIVKTRLAHTVHLVSHTMSIRPYQSKFVVLRTL